MLGTAGERTPSPRGRRPGRTGPARSRGENHLPLIQAFPGLEFKIVTGVFYEIRASSLYARANTGFYLDIILREGKK